MDQLVYFCFPFCSSFRSSELVRLGSRLSARRVDPRQEFPEGRAAMTVVRLFARSEFGESLSNLGKVKHGIVAEAARPAQVVENDAFGHSAKSRKRLPVSRCGNDADESSRAFFSGHAVQFAQHSCVIRVVIRVLIGLVGLLRRIARGMNAGRAV